jgi:hypothetical protein
MKPSRVADSQSVADNGRGGHMLNRSAAERPEKPPLSIQPPYRDWCVWLGLVAIIAAVGPSWTGDVASGIPMEAFAVAFQWLLFAALPASIRRGGQPPVDPAIAVHGRWHSHHNITP